MTNAKDHERLNLLKEVAGTRVYEQRRAESLRIMQETETKRNKIGELLEYIESRLAELEEEKAELKEYQEKDKDRRCLEYAMYSRELEEVQKALEDIEDDRLGEIHNSNLRTEQFEHRQKETQVSSRPCSYKINWVLTRLLSDWSWRFRRRSTNSIRLTSRRRVQWWNERTWSNPGRRCSA